MIERLLLPHWAMTVEESINKVSGATFDEPHDLRQARGPSFRIPNWREQQMRVRGHHDRRVQIDGYGVLTQTALEDQLPSLRG